MEFSPTNRRPMPAWLADAVRLQAVYHRQVVESRVLRYAADAADYERHVKRAMAQAIGLFLLEHDRLSFTAVERRVSDNRWSADPDQEWTMSVIPMSRVHLLTLVTNAFYAGVEAQRNGGTGYAG